MTSMAWSKPLFFSVYCLASRPTAIPSPVLYRCCSLSGWNFLGINAKPNNDPNAGCTCSDDPVVVGGVTSLWRSSLQPVTGGATISFQLDKLLEWLLVLQFIVCYPKWIHKYYQNRQLNNINFLADYPATLAAERERLINYRCVIGKKKSCQKKNIITKDGVNRIPTHALYLFQCKCLERKKAKCLQSIDKRSSARKCMWSVKAALKLVFWYRSWLVKLTNQQSQRGKTKLLITYKINPATGSCS